MKIISISRIIYLRKLSKNLARKKKKKRAKFMNENLKNFPHKKLIGKSVTLTKRFYNLEKLLVHQIIFQGNKQKMNIDFNEP